MNHAADIVTSYRRLHPQAGILQPLGGVSAGPIVRRYFKRSPDASAELTSLLTPGDSRR